jgi:hypothetical protein
VRAALWDVGLFCYTIPPCEVRKWLPPNIPHSDMHSSAGGEGCTKRDESGATAQIKDQGSSFLASRALNTFVQRRAREGLIVVEHNKIFDIGLLRDAKFQRCPVRLPFASSGFPSEVLAFERIDDLGLSTAKIIISEDSRFLRNARQPPRRVDVRRGVSHDWQPAG